MADARYYKEVTENSYDLGMYLFIIATELLAEECSLVTTAACRRRVRRRCQVRRVQLGPILYNYYYMSSKQCSQRKRLNLQHYLFKDLLGYNIHPDITVRNDKDFKIADVGTGTGYEWTL